MEISTRFIKTTLTLITVGIWIIVFQNAGIIPQMAPQKIAVDSTMQVSGSVDVDNTVFIKGAVDANIESINGYNKFYKDPRTGQYYVIPTTDPYQ